MNIVFLGTSKFGRRCLSTVANIPGISVAGVITAPRSFKISYSKEKPVTNVLHADFQDLCTEISTPLIELNGKMTASKIAAKIKDWTPDFILVVGWYHLIPKSILTIPSKGIAGIHASLLPRYRGGAPLVWAMIQGEKETGLSFFYFDEGVDTGDIIGQKVVSIGLNDTIASVYEKIEQSGVDLLTEMMPLISDGTAPRKSQEPLPAGHRPVWPQRSPENGLINWSSSTPSIYNFIRAQTRPYPGAFTTFRNKRLTIWESKPYDSFTYQGKPGEILAIIDNGPLPGILIATTDNNCPLLLTEIQIGAESLKGEIFALQYDITKGEILGL